MTQIAVCGVFMIPLGWDWALFVWGYALAWFLVNDRLKLLAYRFLDPAKVAPATGKSPGDADRKSGITSVILSDIREW